MAASGRAGAHSDLCNYVRPRVEFEPIRQLRPAGAHRRVGRNLLLASNWIRFWQPASFVCNEITPPPRPPLTRVRPSSSASISPLGRPLSTTDGGPPPPPPPAKAPTPSADRLAASAATTLSSDPVPMIVIYAAYCVCDVQCEFALVCSRVTLPYVYDFMLLAVGLCGALRCV